MLFLLGICSWRKGLKTLLDRGGSEKGIGPDDWVTLETCSDITK